MQAIVRRVVAPTFTLIALVVFVRFALEDVTAHVVRSYWSDYSPDLLQTIFHDQPWWTLWLPNRHVQGGYWTTTGWIAMRYLDLAISPAGTFLVANCLLVLVSYLCSYGVFRSVVFSSTLALCLGFANFHYSTYHITGCMISTWMLIYAILNMFAAFKVLATSQLRWRMAFCGTLAVVAISYEGWLDHGVFLLVALCAIWWVGRRVGDRGIERNARFLGTALALGTVTYLAIRVSTVGAPGSVHSFGSEADTVLTYRNWTMTVEDVLQNTFTYPYMSVATFLPDALHTSMTLQRFTNREIIAAQGGYHHGFEAYVLMNHIFLWRFFAGAIVAALVFCLAHVVHRLKARLEDGSVPTTELFMGLFLVLILLGSPAHNLVKFRPFMAVPIWGYKHVMSTFGAATLLAYGLMTCRQRFARPRNHTLFVVLALSCLLGTFLSKPRTYERRLRLLDMCYSCPLPDPIGKVGQWLAP